MVVDSVAVRISTSDYEKQPIIKKDKNTEIYYWNVVLDYAKNARLLHIREKMFLLFSRIYANIYVQTTDRPNQIIEGFFLFIVVF